MSRRKQNEGKFQNRERLEDNGRIYWYDVQGRKGWKARYVKEVDEKEATRRFWQEIYDENGTLVEIHKKFPVDKGHQKLT